MLRTAKLSSPSDHKLHFLLVIGKWLITVNSIASDMTSMMLQAYHEHTGWIWYKAAFYRGAASQFTTCSQALVVYLIKQNPRHEGSYETEMKIRSNLRPLMIQDKETCHFISSLTA